MKSLIYWNSNFHNKPELLAGVAKDLHDQHLVNDIDQTLAALNHREEIGNTLLAANLAVPHVQDSTVLSPVIVFVANQHPLTDWQDGAAVDRFIFVLLPMKCPATDSMFIKQLFISLADDTIMDLLAHGTEKNIQEILK